MLKPQDTLKALSDVDMRSQVQGSIRDAAAIAQTQLAREGAKLIESFFQETPEVTLPALATYLRQYDLPWGAGIHETFLRELRLHLNAHTYLQTFFGGGSEPRSIERFTVFLPRPERFDRATFDNTRIALEVLAPFTKLRETPVQFPYQVGVPTMERLRLKPTGGDTWELFRTPGRPLLRAASLRELFLHLERQLLPA